MSVNTQFDNLGDALINRELALALAARAETLLDLSRCPDSFVRTLAVEDAPSIRILRHRGYARLIAAMLAARLRGRDCLFFLNPGGLGGRLRARKRASMAVYNLMLGLLRLTGVRLALVGVSFDAMGPIDRRLVQWRSALLSTLWVRDTISAAYLGTCGITVHGIAPDLSFGLYEAADTEPASGSDIAFSFRSDKGHAGGDAQLRSLIDSIIASRGEARRYRFVVQVGRDTGLMTTLFEHTRAKVGQRASLHLVTDDIPACLAAYAGCAAIYSNRLHAILLAIRSGAAPCATLAPGSTDKFKGVFADLGIDDQIHWLDGRPPPAALPRPVDPARLRAQADLLARRFDALLDPRTAPAERTAPVQPARSDARS